MQLTCPKCQNNIASQNISVQHNLAKCDNCSEVHQISSLLNKPVQAEAKLVNHSKITSVSLPAQSNIGIRKGDDKSLVIFQPKEKRTDGVLGLQALRLIFSIAFTIFWIVGAAQGSVDFALLGVPMLIILLISLAKIPEVSKDIQTIKVTKDTITIIKEYSTKKKITEIPIQDIQAVRMKAPEQGIIDFTWDIRYRKKLSTVMIEVPTVVCDRTNYYFFERATDGEQEWVVVVLNNLLQKIRSM